MIVPAIYGAFGNFLLPTQLGVHDVAFPRLNSAAFWFLPGGLIMLCQLICTDRRYQRMNCFNIRELQSILKRKFFTDLFNSHDHRELLGKSMIGLRYTMNNNLNINHDLLSFYQFGVYTEAQTKASSFVNFYTAHAASSSSIFATLAHYANPFLNHLNPTALLNSLVSNLFYIYKLFLFETFQFLTFTKSFDVIYCAYACLHSHLFLNIFYICGTITNPFSLNIKYFFSSDNVTSVLKAENEDASNLPVSYQSNSGSVSPDSLNMMYQYSEHSLLGAGRITRYSLPLVNYDYKCGNYLGI
jgi:hypothetical protein